MRVFLFVIAIISGLGALWLWFAQPVQPSAIAGVTQGAATTPFDGSSNSTVMALVAQRDLATGTVLAPEDVAWASVPLTDLPQGAALQAVQPDAATRMAGMNLLRDIATGAPLSWADLATKDAAALSSQIAADHFAFSIVVSEATGVAGLIEPGDRIDLARIKVMPGTSQRSFEIVARDIKVLAVDQRLDRLAPDAARPARTLTLELTAALVERVSLAQAENGVSVILRPEAGATSGADQGNGSP